MLFPEGGFQLSQAGQAELATTIVTKWGRCTICSKLHAKQDQCIVARVRRFGAKVAASFVSHATAPGVRCHAAPHSVT